MRLFQGLFLETRSRALGARLRPFKVQANHPGSAWPRRRKISAEFRHPRIETGAQYSIFGHQRPVGLSGHIGHQYFQTRPFPCRIRPGGFAMDPESITPGRAGLGAAPCKSTKAWPTPCACLSRLLRDRTQLRELSGKTEPSRNF